MGREMSMVEKDTPKRPGGRGMCGPYAAALLGDCPASLMVSSVCWEWLEECGVCRQKRSLGRWSNVTSTIKPVHYIYTIHLYKYAQPHQYAFIL